LKTCQDHARVQDKTKEAQAQKGKDMKEKRLYKEALDMSSGALDRTPDMYCTSIEDWIEDECTGCIFFTG
jgi:hypothetical protein